MAIPKSENAFLHVLKVGGWVGVDLFFVLSGFLVSGLLFHEIKLNGKVNLLRFLIRRGIKIYPPFWIFIFTTIVGYALVNKDINSRSLLGELMFLQNYTSHLWAHTWSLAVEEHFYFILAFVIFVLMAGSRPRMPLLLPLFLLVSAACLVFRIQSWDGSSAFDFKANLYPTHLRVDSLFFGVLLSYFCHFHELKNKLLNVPTFAFILGGCALLAPAFIFPVEITKWVSVYGVMMFAVGSGLLVFASTRIENVEYLLLDRAAVLGSSSYCIYLWHMPINNLVQLIMLKINLNSFWIYFFSYMVGSLIIGHVLSRIIEIPSLRIREKVMPKL